MISFLSRKQAISLYSKLVCGPFQHYYQLITSGDVLFHLHHEMALEFFTKTQRKLLTTIVLTNCPKGRRKK